MLPGKAAVVAEVWEEWVLPVDVRMAAAGGMVFRRKRVEIADAQIERDIETLRAEDAALEDELSRATGETRAMLQKRLDETHDRSLAVRESITEKITIARQETEAKIHLLQDRSSPWYWIPFSFSRNQLACPAFLPLSVNSIDREGIISVKRSAADFNSPILFMSSGSARFLLFNRTCAIVFSICILHKSLFKHKQRICCASAAIPVNIG